jgi:hypothetical protein
MEATWLRYLVPYAKIRTFLGLTDVESTSVHVHNFDDLIDVQRHLLMAVPVDEQWYLRTYPDVAGVIAGRSYFRSAAHHFVGSGYFEGRMPFECETEERRFPPPFTETKSMLSARPKRGRLAVEISDADLLRLIRQYLVAVPFDAPWYLATYPDVALAITAARFANASAHFIASGYFEGRWPFDIPLDEEWYLSSYPDLGQAQRENAAFSAEQHFRRSGYREGRQPTPELSRMLTGV